MNEHIPGGRPRASSESDILDENLIENIENHSLTLDHKNFSRSIGNHLCEDINSDEETITNGKGYYTLQTKDKRRNKPLFKSVKKIVSRIRRSANSPSVDVKGDMNAGKGGYNPQSNDVHEDAGSVSKRISDSTSRPLITKSLSVALPWKVCPGTVGIQNHGNTCFMNAVLQCLSNTDVFTGYFVTKQHKQDLKSRGFSKKFSNSKSDLTEQLGTLLECIWSNTYSPDVSNTFKSTVGKYNNQYKGSSQHDAQEFLLWLLDSINEELFVTSKKKYKSIKSKDTSDESLAEEVLTNSNGCQVYNMFQALYRSSLQCPDCSKQSNTFETYLCLSLPLPHKTKRPVFVTIVYLDGNPRQARVGVNINIQDTVKELREMLADSMKIPVTQLVLCQIQEDGFRCTFSDDQPISDISETEMVYALETLPMPAPDSVQESPYLQLIVVHTVRQSSPIKYSRFSPPQVLKVARDVDYKMLQREILKHMADCVKEGLLSQKLDILFRLRVLDGSSGKEYLPHDVEMPLLTQLVERALSICREEYGPHHIKLVAEWEPTVQERVIVNENNEVEEYSSYRQLRQSFQHPFKVSLNECLQLFTTEEILSGDDAWNCPHCQKQQKAATKTLGLWSLPNVLVIHLKRFRQLGSRRNKLNTLVDFPVKNMDMSDHILQRNSTNNERQIYDLYGVCNHYGNMLGGHYTAFCRNPLDEKWYEFDDSKVKPLSEAEVKTSSAYMLFYQKRGTNAHVIEGLQNRTHWIFKLCPALLNVNLKDFKNVKFEQTNLQEENLLSVQSQQNEETEGIFSRQNSGRSDMSSKSDDKSHILAPTNSLPRPPAHGVGHVSSKLVHNITSSSHTVSPEVLNNALSPKSQINNIQFVPVETNLSQSTKRNGDLKQDIMDSSLDVNLKVRLPPSAGTKQTNMKVDVSDKPPPPARTNLYDRQNAYKPSKPDKPPATPPKIEPFVKSYSENYSNNEPQGYSSNTQKPMEIPPRLPPKESQRSYPSQKTRTDGDTQRNRNDSDVQRNRSNSDAQRNRNTSDAQRNRTLQQNKQYDDVDSKKRVTISSPPQTRKTISTNWSTPQPPRKNSTNQSPQSPFKRQNSIPAKRSSSSSRYTRLTPSRSEEDLATQTLSRQRGYNPREDENGYDQRNDQKGYDKKEDQKELNSIIPSNKGVNEIIDKYNTLTKKSSPNLEQEKLPIGTINRRNAQGRSSRNDAYRRSDSFQNAKNSIDKFDQPGQQKVSKSSDDVYEKRVGHLTNDSNINQNQSSTYTEPVDRLHISKSKTDDNLAYNTPHIYEAGSRKPVYEPSHSDTASFSDDLKRYRPHKHYTIKPKEKIKSFKKEKLYSPCIKESSV